MSYLHFLILGLSLTLTAQAQVQVACKKEIETHCKGLPEPVKENFYKCLHLKFTSLSFPCQQEIDANLTHTPCYSDIKMDCSGDMRNYLNLLPCLRKREKNLKPECKVWVKERLAEIEKKTAEPDKACANERKLCTGKSGPEEAKCMKDLYNKKKVSPLCAKMLEKYLLKFQH